MRYWAEECYAELSSLRDLLKRISDAGGRVISVLEKPGEDPEFAKYVVVVEYQK